MSSRLLSIVSNIHVFTQAHYFYSLIALELAIIVIIFYLSYWLIFRGINEKF